MAFQRHQPDAAERFDYISEFDTAWSVQWFHGIDLTKLPTDEARNTALLAKWSEQYPEAVTEKVRKIKKTSALLETLEHAYRGKCHAKYAETGDESHLGVITDDVFRWKLHSLPAKYRATVKGMMLEGLGTEIEKQYDVGRYILSKTLVGCAGWHAYANGANGHVSEETLDMIEDEFVTDIGHFVYRLGTLRAPEKKA